MRDDQVTQPDVLVAKQKNVDIDDAGSPASRRPPSTIAFDLFRDP
jgi:hypothetical protein